MLFTHGRWGGETKMKLFKRYKAKHYDLRSELAKWVKKNLGDEWVDEALEKYDKINSGIPIGSFDETVVFIDMIETIKAEVEGR